MNKTTYSCSLTGFVFTSEIVPGKILPKIMVHVPGRTNDFLYNELNFTQIRNLIPKRVMKQIEHVMRQETNIRTPSAI